MLTFEGSVFVAVWAVFFLALVAIYVQARVAYRLAFRAHEKADEAVTTADKALDLKVERYSKDEVKRAVKLQNFYNKLADTKGNRR